MRSRIYRCQNRECGCEVLVIKPPGEGSLNPRCCCGAEMKKPYRSPVLTKRLTDPIESTLDKLFEQAVLYAKFWSD
jgi:hypothetical protein